MSGIVNPMQSQFPASSLTIVTKAPPLGAFVNPTAIINGHTVPLRWGENVIPAQPGVHHVTVYMQWLWRVGLAAVTVDNTTRPAPPIHYALPYNGFQKGAIGTTPQKNPGLAPLLVVLGGIFLVTAACCLAAAFLE